MKKMLGMLLMVLVTGILAACTDNTPSNEFTIATWAAGTELSKKPRYKATLRSIFDQIRGHAPGCVHRQIASCRPWTSNQ